MDTDTGNIQRTIRRKVANDDGGPWEILTRNEFRGGVNPRPVEREFLKRPLSNFPVSNYVSRSFRDESSAKKSCRSFNKLFESRASRHRRAKTPPPSDTCFKSRDLRQRPFARTVDHFLSSKLRRRNYLEESGESFEKQRIRRNFSFWLSSSVPRVQF